jgi:putative redox protein
MYVERKQWNIQNIKVKVSLERADTEGMVTHTFRAEIFVDEPVPNEQKERLLYIAKACPISKLLSKQNEVITKLAT